MHRERERVCERGFILAGLIVRVESVCVGGRRRGIPGNLVPRPKVSERAPIASERVPIARERERERERERGVLKGEFGRVIARNMRVGE